MGRRRWRSLLPCRVPRRSIKADQRWEDMKVDSLWHRVRRSSEATLFSMYKIYFSAARRSRSVRYLFSPLLSSRWLRAF